MLQGRAEGRAAAQTEWESRLAALAESLAAAARGLLGRRIELAAEVERQLPKLVLLLTRKVLHQELAHSDVAAQTVIRGVAERLAGLGRPVVVRLAPEFREDLGEGQEAFVKRAGFPGPGDGPLRVGHAGLRPARAQVHVGEAGPK